MPLVFNQRPAFSMAEVTLVVNVMLGANMIAAHFESVVDSVDNDRLEVMIAFGNELAGVKKVVPFVSWNLEYFLMIEPRFALKKDRFREF